MSKVKRGVTSKARHKKIIKLVKGFRGRSKNCFRIAIQKAEKSFQYAYRDRKRKKREFRSLWIQRINAATTQSGLSYSQFVKGTKILGIILNRKILSEIAIHNSQVFTKLLSKVKQTLDKKSRDSTT